ncbi:hypothetical protein JVT61DRAFT_12412 [Boletus reticuloceps]|uniref:Uncharacterized protein n=1 Tax=Boletus reticuloceps TaxID=495285 RepID=A0A8I3A3Z4_9AGAM|nr:hypothetical protein JVT61DRAFT_12412 [Boletus reticuloceps]
MGDIQVVLAHQYLDVIGIDVNHCSEDQKALIICCNLWMELSNLGTLEKEAVGEAGRSTQVRHTARESLFVMDTSEHFAGEEPEPEPGLGLGLGDGGDADGMNISDDNVPRRHSETAEDPGSIVLEWARILNNFFYSEDQCERTENMAIQALREMRRAAKTKRSREEFGGYIGSCGLAKVILIVGKEWMEIANRSEFMQGSFRRHQWREALLICLTQLTQGFVPKPTDTILKEIRELTDATTQTQGSQVSAKRLLLLMSERKMVPMAVKPHSIFFLCSEQNFVAACFDWIISSVSETREIKLEAGDITRMYRSICRLTEDNWSSWDLSPEMRVILKLSRRLREDRKAWKAEAHRSRNRNRNPEGNPEAPECQACAHMDVKDKCVQYHIVREITSNNAVQKKLVIPDEDDVLKPLSKGVHKIAERCVPLSKLGLQHISFKEEIYQHCGQLVIHLVDDRTQEEVAGVMFNLLAEEEIQRLAENQANIKKLTRKLKRRKAMSEWGYGEMRPIGSRQPPGGRPGDGYAPYPESTVLSQEDIHTLFAYASVCLWIDEV